MDLDASDVVLARTIHPELLQGFLAEIEEAGFERSGLTEWTGPLPGGLRPFTQTEAMTIVIQDGWPYFPPGLRVEGIASWHANVDSLCLWQVGDDTRRWVTVKGILQRIDEWVEDARTGFSRHGQGLDPHLYFERQSVVRALIDVTEFVEPPVTDGQSGRLSWSQVSHGVLHIHPGPFGSVVPLPSGINDRSQVAGRWFFRENVPAPPRTAADYLGALTDSQRRILLSDIRRVARRMGIFALFWRVSGQIAALLVAAGDDKEARDLQCLTPVPFGEEAQLLRAGPDAHTLRTKSVLVVGLGAVGSHLAELLARSAVGSLRLADFDSLWPANVIRHATDPRVQAGTPKVLAVRDALAPYSWVSIDAKVELLRDHRALRERLGGVDLAVDATGDRAFSEFMARVASEAGVPFLTVALYRGGSLSRVQRQADGDRPIWLRMGHAHSPEITPGPDEIEYLGLETGCLGPVNNAPPVAVVRAASLAAEICVDLLTGRRSYPDETIEVYKPSAPVFDTIGTVRKEDLPTVLHITEAAQAAMRHATHRAAPNETGGVLVGTHVDGHPVVTDAIEISAERPAPSRFIIEEGKTRQAVEAAAAVDPRVGYMGEWHSHPLDQDTSNTDRVTMQMLAGAPDIGNPALIVARLQTTADVRLDSYMVRPAWIVPVRMESVGGLPLMSGAPAATNV